MMSDEGRPLKARGPQEGDESERARVRERVKERTWNRLLARRGSGIGG